MFTSRLKPNGQRQMSELLTDRVVRLIEDSSADGCPAEELFPIVYEQLKELARHLMAGERRDHTLQATALVHEAYLRLLGGRELSFAGRAHFFNAAARAMRRVLVDHARLRAKVKRGGGGLRRLPLQALDLAREDRLPDLLAIDEAMDRLEAFSPAVAAVVRLRFYAGLDQRETAAALGISERTVRREWTYGRAWLSLELDNGRD